jgi:hypothetical protein
MSLDVEHAVGLGVLLVVVDDAVDEEVVDEEADVEVEGAVFASPNFELYVAVADEELLVEVSAETPAGANPDAE